MTGTPFGQVRPWAAADDKLEQAIGVAIDETVDYHAGTHTPPKPELPTLPHVDSHPSAESQASLKRWLDHRNREQK